MANPDVRLWPDHPPPHDQALHELAEHDAALTARVHAATRLATICECQTWLRQAADSLMRMGRVKAVEDLMRAGAQGHRNSADLLELMKARP